MRKEENKSLRIDRVRLVGGESGLFDIMIKDGTYESIRKSAVQMQKPGEKELWISLGLSDLHLHTGWTDFLHEKQEQRSKEDVEQRICESLTILKKMGITTIRDAGGITPQEFRRLAEERAVYEEKDSDWVKIFATGGVGASPDKVLTPLMSEAVFRDRIDTIHRSGMKAMIHTWGGESLDWSIRYGADSIEHGIYMTREQAAGMAEKNIAYIPTCCIYQIIADPHGPLGFLPDFFREHAKYACEHHPDAVGSAKQEGVSIYCGTDFYSDPELISYELQELFTMKEYGMSMAEVWNSAVSGIRFLNENCRRGRIEQGYIADYVLYEGNPLQASSKDQLQKMIVDQK